MSLHRGTAEDLSQVHNNKAAQKFHEVCTDIDIKLELLEILKE